MENYRYMYRQCKMMLEKYQDEIVPGFREQVEKLEKELHEVKSERNRAISYLNRIKDTTTDHHTYNLVALFFNFGKEKDDEQEP